MSMYNLITQVQKLQREGTISAEECADILKNIEQYDEKIVNRIVNEFYNKVTMRIEKLNNELVNVDKLILEIKDVADEIKINHKYDDDIRRSFINIENAKEELEECGSSECIFEALDEIYPLLRELQKLRNRLL